ncbi:hypothetical protein QTH87_18960 [Variovorax sp. J22P168]|uniref:hypothetical protein n=1 Tax=Variovorax jilinensis TaxID=3053513 RepID=UPI002579140A|nr:hypothetical protein [Variovorax sp. J22P168]MDM0014530.1 hypothetical protein [Variovorax sp. J22P168]
MGSDCLSLPSMALSNRCKCSFIAGLAILIGSPAGAQLLADQVRGQVESARLGSGYAQMINLSVSPDFSAASYRIDADEPGSPRPTLNVIRAPYQAHWLAISPDADLYGRISGGYLEFKQQLPLGPAFAPVGSVDSRWSAYSVTGGLLAKVRLGNGFTLEPALDLGVARLDNNASYRGSGVLLRPALDGLVFNWQTNAWLATPSLGLAWTGGGTDGQLSLRGHVARSWIGSFDATDRVQEFSEAVNIYSVRAEYTMSSGLRAWDRPLRWVAYGDYAGFFGANRDALGFDAVAELGGGVEWPLALGPGDLQRLRLSAGYLFGPGVRGWTLGLSLQY